MGVGALNSDFVASKLGGVLTQQEVKLKSRIENMGESTDSSELLMLQHELQKVSMFTQLVSTIYKVSADTDTGVIRNIQ